MGSLGQDAHRVHVSAGGAAGQVVRAGGGRGALSRRAAPRPGHERRSATRLRRRRRRARRTIGWRKRNHIGLSVARISDAERASSSEASTSAWSSWAMSATRSGANGSPATAALCSTRQAVRREPAQLIRQRFADRRREHHIGTFAGCRHGVGVCARRGEARPVERPALCCPRELLEVERVAPALDETRARADLDRERFSSNGSTSRRPRGSSLMCSHPSRTAESSGVSGRPVRWASSSSVGEGGGWRNR